ncbi:MAG: hypothetical protein ACJAX1_003103, partial [Neolewinella sp.]
LVLTITVVLLRQLVVLGGDEGGDGKEE